MLAAYKCFASGVSLLVYAVATFALSKPSDLSPIAVGTQSAHSSWD